MIQQKVRAATGTGTNSSCCPLTSFKLFDFLTVTIITIVVTKYSKRASAGRVFRSSLEFTKMSVNCKIWPGFTKYAFIHIYFGLGLGKCRVYPFWQFWWFWSSNGLQLINLCQKTTNISGFGIKKAKIVASFVQKH